MMRKMSVAGQFYPLECSEIKRYIEVFSQELKAEKQEYRALISPHAGYVYSGFTANLAYSKIDFSKIKRVVVIGPSHRVYLKGASIALYATYETPCADMKIDTKYSQELKNRYDFLDFQQNAHAEHSTETQVPFIQFYAAHVSLVEVVYGELNDKDLVPLLEEVLKDKESFLVISTDLSHFYDLNKANTLDKLCLKAVNEMNISDLDRGCEACGMIGVKAVLQASKNLDLKSKVIDYRTSADASNDKSRVVGYMSALISQKP